MSPFSRISLPELTDLLLSLIALTIGFAILGESGIPGANVFLVSAVGVGTGFLLHEMAHKFVAQKYGYWAEYRANRLGLIVIIFMAHLGFILAAPGAVMIRKESAYGFPQDYSSGYDEGLEQMKKKASSEMLRISLAGPMTNIILMGFFLTLLAGGFLTGPLAIAAARYAFFINLILAGFNLIPFGPLDGAKVYQANRRVWAAVAVPTLLLALPVFFGISII